MDPYHVSSVSLEKTCSVFNKKEIQWPRNDIVPQCSSVNDSLSNKRKKPDVPNLENPKRIKVVDGLLENNIDNQIVSCLPDEIEIKQEEVAESLVQSDPFFGSEEAISVCIKEENIDNMQFNNADSEALNEDDKSIVFSECLNIFNNPLNEKVNNFDARNHLNPKDYSNSINLNSDFSKNNFHLNDVSSDLGNYNSRSLKNECKICCLSFDTEFQWLTHIYSKEHNEVFLNLKKNFGIKPSEECSKGRRKGPKKSMPKSQLCGNVRLGNKVSCLDPVPYVPVNLLNRRIIIFGDADFVKSGPKNNRMPKVNQTIKSDEQNLPIIFVPYQVHVFSDDNKPKLVQMYLPHVDQGTSKALVNDSLSLPSNSWIGSCTDPIKEGFKVKFNSSLVKPSHEIDVAQTMSLKSKDDGISTCSKRNTLFKSGSLKNGRSCPSIYKRDTNYTIYHTFGRQNIVEEPEEAFMRNLGLLSVKNLANPSPSSSPFFHSYSSVPNKVTNKNISTIFLTDKPIQSCSQSLKDLDMVSEKNNILPLNVALHNSEVCPPKAILLENKFLSKNLPKKDLANIVPVHAPLCGKSNLDHFTCSSLKSTMAENVSKNTEVALSNSNLVNINDLDKLLTGELKKPLIHFNDHLKEKKITQLMNNSKLNEKTLLQEEKSQKNNGQVISKNLNTPADNAKVLEKKAESTSFQILEPENANACLKSENRINVTEPILSNIVKNKTPEQSSNSCLQLDDLSLGSSQNLTEVNSKHNELKSSNESSNLTDYIIPRETQSMNCNQNEEKKYDSKSIINPKSENMECDEHSSTKIESHTVNLKTDSNTVFLLENNNINIKEKTEIIVCGTADIVSDQDVDFDIGSPKTNCSSEDMSRTESCTEEMEDCFSDIEDLNNKEYSKLLDDL